MHSESYSLSSLHFFKYQTAVKLYLFLCNLDNSFWSQSSSDLIYQTAAAFCCSTHLSSWSITERGLLLIAHIKEERAAARRELGEEVGKRGCHTLYIPLTTTCCCCFTQGQVVQLWAAWISKGTNGSVLPVRGMGRESTDKIKQQKNNMWLKERCHEQGFSYLSHRSFEKPSPG